MAQAAELLWATGLRESSRPKARRMKPFVRSNSMVQRRSQHFGTATPPTANGSGAGGDHHNGHAPPAATTERPRTRSKTQAPPVERRSSRAAAAPPKPSPNPSVTAASIQQQSHTPWYPNAGTHTMAVVKGSRKQPPLPYARPASARASPQPQQRREPPAPPPAHADVTPPLTVARASGASVSANSTATTLLHYEAGARARTSVSPVPVVPATARGVRGQQGMSRVSPSPRSPPVDATPPRERMLEQQPQPQPPAYTNVSLTSLADDPAGGDGDVWLGVNVAGGRVALSDNGAPLCGECAGKILRQWGGGRGVSRTRPTPRQSAVWRERTAAAVREAVELVDAHRAHKAGGELMYAAGYCVDGDPLERMYELLRGECGGAADATRAAEAESLALHEAHARGAHYQGLAERLQKQVISLQRELERAQDGGRVQPAAARPTTPVGVSPVRGQRSPHAVRGASTPPGSPGAATDGPSLHLPALSPVEPAQPEATTWPLHTAAVQARRARESGSPPSRSSPHGVSPARVKRYVDAANGRVLLADIRQPVAVAAGEAPSQPRPRGRDVQPSWTPTYYDDAGEVAAPTPTPSQIASRGSVAVGAGGCRRALSPHPRDAAARRAAAAALSAGGASPPPQQQQAPTTTTTHARGVSPMQHLPPLVITCTTEDETTPDVRSLPINPEYERADLHGKVDMLQAAVLEVTSGAASPVEYGHLLKWFDQLRRDGVALQTQLAAAASEHAALQQLNADLARTLALTPTPGGDTTLVSPRRAKGVVPPPLSDVVLPKSPTTSSAREPAPAKRKRADSDSKARRRTPPTSPMKPSGGSPASNRSHDVSPPRQSYATAFGSSTARPCNAPMSPTAAAVRRGSEGSRGSPRSRSCSASRTPKSPKSPVSPRPPRSPTSPASPTPAPKSILKSPRQRAAEDAAGPPPQYVSSAFDAAAVEALRIERIRSEESITVKTPLAVVSPTSGMRGRQESHISGVSAISERPAPSIYTDGASEGISMSTSFPHGCYAPPHPPTPDALRPRVSPRAGEQTGNPSRFDIPLAAQASTGSTVVEGAQAHAPRSPLTPVEAGGVRGGNGNGNAAGRGGGVATADMNALDFMVLSAGEPQRSPARVVRVEPQAVAVPPVQHAAAAAGSAVPTRRVRSPARSAGSSASPSISPMLSASATAPAEAAGGGGRGMPYAFGSSIPRPCTSPAGSPPASPSRRRPVRTLRPPGEDAEAGALSLSTASSSMHSTAASPQQRRRQVSPVARRPQPAAQAGEHRAARAVPKLSIPSPALGVEMGTRNPGYRAVSGGGGGGGAGRVFLSPRDDVAMTATGASPPAQETPRGRLPQDLPHTPEGGGGTRRRPSPYLSSFSPTKMPSPKEAHAASLTLPPTRQLSSPRETVLPPATISPRAPRGASPGGVRDYTLDLRGLVARESLLNASAQVTDRDKDVRERVQTSPYRTCAASPTTQPAQSPAAQRTLSDLHMRETISSSQKGVARGDAAAASPDRPAKRAQKPSAKKVAGKKGRGGGGTGKPAAAVHSSGGEVDYLNDFHLQAPKSPRQDLGSVAKPVTPHDGDSWSTGAATPATLPSPREMHGAGDAPAASPTPTMLTEPQGHHTLQSVHSERTDRTHPQQDPAGVDGRGSSRRDSALSADEVEGLLRTSPQAPEGFEAMEGVHGDAGALTASSTGGDADADADADDPTHEGDHPHTAWGGRDETGEEEPPLPAAAEAFFDHPHRVGDGDDATAATEAAPGGGEEDVRGAEEDEDLMGGLGATAPASVTSTGELTEGHASAPIPRLPEYLDVEEADGVHSQASPPAHSAVFPDARVPSASGGGGGGGITAVPQPQVQPQPHPHAPVAADEIAMAASTSASDFQQRLHKVRERAWEQNRLARVTCLNDLIALKARELKCTEERLIHSLIYTDPEARMLLSQLETQPDGTVKKEEWLDWFKALSSIGQNPDHVVTYLLAHVSSATPVSVAEAPHEQDTSLISQQPSHNHTDSWMSVTTEEAGEEPRDLVYVGHGHDYDRNIQGHIA